MKELEYEELYTTADLEDTISATLDHVVTDIIAREGPDEWPFSLDEYGFFFDWDKATFSPTEGLRVPITIEYQLNEDLEPEEWTPSLTRSKCFFCINVATRVGTDVVTCDEHWEQRLL